MNHIELTSTVHYDPETVVFVRTKSAGNTAAGHRLGNIDAKGYLKALVLGKYVKLHRLAWFYMHGTWPTEQVDHINGCKTDNRMVNLRVCDTSANCLNQVGPRKNNELGYQGVHQIKKTGRFRAACNLQGVKHHLGVFATAEEAYAAYTAFKAPHIPERI